MTKGMTKGMATWRRRAQGQGAGPLTGGSQYAHGDVAADGGV